jgi:hypothetical protein
MAPCNFTMTIAHWGAQVAVTVSMMLFCMFMIAFRGGALEIFLPLLTSIISVWMPSPGIPQKRHSNAGIEAPPNTPDSTATRASVVSI